MTAINNQNIVTGNPEEEYYCVSEYIHGYELEGAGHGWNVMGKKSQSKN